MRLRSLVFASLVSITLGCGGLGCGAARTDDGEVPLDGSPTDDASGSEGGGDDTSTSPIDSGGSETTEFDFDTGTVDDTGTVFQDGGGLQDALPDVVSDACSEGGVKLGPGPLKHTCGALTTNECDGKTDTNPALPNGTYGNGYDDDCDGQVDEGCECDPGHPVGTTKDCYLVPASQADPSTKLPAGWCTENSKGTTACVQVGSGEFKSQFWDGYCKGAQPPFADDVCAAGDFNCDGLASNSQSLDCACPSGPVVTCPTAPIVTSPYPNPKDLTQKKATNPLDPSPGTPFIIDGNSWVGSGTATGWTWTVTGGDCDDILPHPTFAIYNGLNSSTATRLGTESSTLGTTKKEKGLVTTKNDAQHEIWPAFSLSGDYIVQGDFDVGGTHYTCTQKVQVRWPGLRAEMCWDTKGGAEGTATDVDLHLGRLQGTTCTGSHGWFDTCGTAPKSDDCFYDCGSGCRTGNKGFCQLIPFSPPAPAPGWGYTVSGTDACHGWGSLRETQQTCDNPRLDRDNLACDAKQADPLNANFCGPENINIDNPKTNDAFAIGTHYYTGAANPPDATVHPHVTIYCNGERKLALGYDPTTTPVTDFPRLSTAFDSDPNAPGWNGDFWEVARVTWTGDATNPCTIDPVPSKTFKPAKDGSPNLCVDTNAQNGSATGSQPWLFTAGGGEPTTAAGLCWH